jgi:hypothetical protein
MNIAQMQFENLAKDLDYHGTSQALEDGLYLELQRLRRASDWMQHACDSCRWYEPDEPERVFRPTGVCCNVDSELFRCPVGWNEWCADYEGVR